MDSLIEKNNAAAEAYRADRRGFLKHGLLFSAALGFWTPALAAETSQPTTGRQMLLSNIHTGEKFSGEYWYDGKYIPEAFKEIKALLRDHRTDEKFPIDPRLMDILFVLQNRTKNFNAFEVFSGYRSPTTNAHLRKTSSGVARGSLHMQGQAIDVSQKGTRLGHLERAAINLKSGGVGFYPSSGFVHIDTGRTRNW